MGCASGRVAPAAEVVERYSGVHVQEHIHPTSSGRRKLLCLHIHCGCLAGSGAARSILNSSTTAAGRRANDPECRSDIQLFINEYSIRLDETELPPEDYPTLNEFFSRKLKPGLRPIASDAGVGAVAVQPADCRLHVFPSVDHATRLYIKGRGFSLSSLIGVDDPRTAAYEGGSLCISRLAPADYHRFHSPVDAVVGSVTQLPGALYTVKPLSITSPLNVFGVNKRECLELHSPQFGKVMMVIVGAVQVGTITRTVKEGQVVQKGDEIGFFSFGGSTVVSVFEKGRIVFDEDLVANSSEGKETYVHMGQPLGVAQTPPVTPDGGGLTLEA
eukprot:Hpha_TRINITY_DN30421_c0_g1::TRINITY_DN30421_c0_g1_i1::g.168127::m.168127/K01613/psd, PISD; phosphatidylserine decarboxylase